MKGLLSLLLSSLIATGVILGSISTNIDAEDLDASQGVQNIKQLESSDVSAVQKIITDYEKELEEKNKPKEEENKGNNNKLDFKSIFKRDMFIGDSQSEGLNLYGFLNDSSVCAQKGRSLYSAMDTVPTVKNANPENIFILFGLNDLIAFPNLNDLRDKYEEFVKALKRGLPDAKIYVNSMLEARSDAIARQSALSLDRNAKGNDLIKEMCSKNGVEFVDIRYIFRENPSLYEGDGMHCKPDFYKVWLTKLKTIKEEAE